MQEFILRIDELLCRSFSLIVTTRITVSCKFSSENQPISSWDLFLMSCNHSDIVTKAKSITYVIFWISSTMFWLVVFQNTHDFLIFCNKILDQYAPRKKKYVRSNHLPFMNKNLSKAIMLRTKLRNIFLKNRTEENKNRYTKQRNLCVTLLRKSKRGYFNN